MINYFQPQLFFLTILIPILYFSIRHLVLFLPEELIAVYPKSIAFRTRTYFLSNESDALFFCVSKCCNRQLQTKFLQFFKLLPAVLNKRLSSVNVIC